MALSYSRFKQFLKNNLKKVFQKQADKYPEYRTKNTDQQVDDFTEMIAEGFCQETINELKKGTPVGPWLGGWIQ